MVFSEMCSDAAWHGFVVYDGMPAAWEGTAVHMELSGVLILVLVCVTRLLTTVYKLLFYICQRRWDWIQVDMDDLLIPVHLRGAKPMGFPKHHLHMVYRKVTKF